LTFVDSYNDVLVLLGLAHFIPLLNCFDYSGRREMSAYLVNNVIGRSIEYCAPPSMSASLTPELWIRIGIDICRLDPEPEQHWECGSGSKGAKIEGISCFELLDVLF
jgi:hypothetical protein